MPDDEKPLPQTSLRVCFSLPVAKELERLRQTGLYGYTLEETAERVICSYLENLNQRFQKEAPFP